MQDLKKKEKLREKFGVKDDWVLPYEVIPIIDIPDFGDKAAVKVLLHQACLECRSVSVGLHPEAEPY